MQKTDKNKKGQKQPDRARAKPAGVTELTEHDLEQVQGGQGLNSRDVSYIKGAPGSGRE